MTTFYKVGKIVNTQGLRGEVRVISTTDFAEERYKKGTELAIFKDGIVPLVAVAPAPLLPVVVIVPTGDCSFIIGCAAR